MLFLRYKKSLTFAKIVKNTSIRHKCSENGAITKIGFIGLGNMGGEMCKNLVKKNYDLLVKDINPTQEEKIKNEGGKVASNYQEIAKFAECIITMLPASNNVESLYFEQGLLRHMNPKTIAIDCSTIDPDVTRELGNAVEENGCFFLDAPVSGGTLAASSGGLTFMVGGNEELLQKTEKIFLAMGKKIFHCGQIGNGQIAKTCNNLLLAISMAGAAEALNLGIKLGMDAKLLTSIMNNSSGRCWSTDVYNPVPGVLSNVPSSKNYKGGFACQMILKDLKIAQRAAKNINSTTLLGKNVSEMYEEMCKMNFQNEDFSIIYQYVKDNFKCLKIQ